MGGNHRGRPRVPPADDTDQEENGRPLPLQDVRVQGCQGVIAAVASHGHPRLFSFLQQQRAGGRHRGWAIARFQPSSCRPFLQGYHPVPEPPAPEPLNVSVSKISDVPKAAGEVAKLAGQKIISAQNKIVPPEPAKPSVSTYAIPYASQLSLDKNGELVLTKNSKVVWSQKGKPGSSLTVGSDNKPMLGSAPLVVSDPAVASSWPFAGYLTKLSNFPRKREALLLLEVGVGLLFANFAGPKLAGLFAGGKANKATKATKGVAKAVKRARVR